MFVIVTGSRDLKDPDGVSALLQECLSLTDETLHVYVGDCPTGADLYARAWVEKMWGEGHPISLRVVGADWGTLGKSAGPIRNRAMAMEAQRSAKVDNSPVFLLAFYQDGALNRGTESCVRAANAYGLEVITLG